jgi:hypothetical protein
MTGIQDGNSMVRLMKLHSNFKKEVISVSKRIIVMLFVFISLLLFSSCDIKSIGGMLVSEEIKANARMEQIISAIKEKDAEALKSLFSKKALDEDDDFDNEIKDLFDLLKGDIISYERDGWSSEESITKGKISLMVRFPINVNTDENAYRFYVIDYNTDTIDPDNEGVYMLEVRLADSKNVGSWQERMRAGIYIH